MGRRRTTEPRMSLERYCACGAKLRTKISSSMQARMLAAWFARHQGATCRPASRQEWQQTTGARARQEGERG